MSSIQLDQDCQLRNWESLVGHTVKAVIQSPAGKRDVSAVIITETGCWMALSADGGYESAQDVEIDRPTFGSDPDIPLNRYVSATDMWRAGLINQATYRLLKEAEEEEKAAERKAKEDRLRKQLQELEGGIE